MSALFGEELRVVNVGLPAFAEAIRSAGGTAADPQGLDRQEAVLREAGVLLAESNAQAVRLAARIASRPGAGR